MIENSLRISKSRPKFRFGNGDGQYIEAILELEKMQYCHSPKDKMVELLSA